jgi:hypothetical protein
MGLCITLGRITGISTKDVIYFTKIALITVRKSMERNCSITYASVDEDSIQALRLIHLTQCPQSAHNMGLRSSHLSYYLQPHSLPGEINQIQPRSQVSKIDFSDITIQHDVGLKYKLSRNIHH